VHVHVLARPVEVWTTQGDYAADSKFRARFKEWLNVLWTEKDARLDALLAERPAAATANGDAA
jgi:hypothetical protein